MNSDRSSADSQTDASEQTSSKHLSDRLFYLNLGENDRERLKSLVPEFEGFAGELVEAFYRHLFAFDDAARFLRDPKLVQRLKLLQQEHFLSLLSADWDGQYVERRNRVGQTHAEIGIDPELFLGAYSQYVQQAFRKYLTTDGDPVSPRVESLLSLLKVVFLDLGLTLDAYFTRATQTMQQALDMYWKANIELRQFAHLTSHDLKTPLATVANLCDEAVDEFGDQMPAEAKRLVEAARQRTFRMSTMIDELLMTTVSFEPAEQLRETSSEAVFAEALERLRPIVQQKRITVIVAEGLPILWADPVRLRESFYNLLSNAVKFVDPDVGRINLEVRPAGVGYVFTLSDNGPGIAAEELDRLFTPFRRNKTGDEHSGSGLGLYFTKTMIEHQGGRIWAESQLGRGSRFHLELRRPPGT